ncbi:MAG: hypothetical protein QF773_04530, partial [Lentisphaeria bacterium]|nr:hypothetical protein [Lentisphaeria bacterium]
PPHVKFLFATTEAHKILPTILSRCQRFDLKRIPVPLIVARLHEIATAEKIFVHDSALTIIARAAEGGMRDAQSILDQMIAFCGGNDESSPISESDVIDVFGLVSHSELTHLVEAILQNDAGALISAVHNLADKGRNLECLYADILLYGRNLMVFGHVSDPRAMLELNDAEFADLQQLAAVATPSVVQRLVQGLLAGDSNIRYTLNKRIYIESTLLRVMRDAHAVQVDDLITQLRILQEKGTLPAVDTAPAPSPPADPVQSTPPAAAAPSPAPVAPKPEAPPTPESASPEPSTPPSPEAEAPAEPQLTLVPDEPAPAAPEPEQQETSSSPDLWQQAEQDETVQGAVDLFGGKIIDVRAVKKD